MFVRFHNFPGKHKICQQRLSICCRIYRIYRVSPPSTTILIRITRTRHSAISFRSFSVFIVLIAAVTMLTVLQASIMYISIGATVRQASLYRHVRSFDVVHRKSPGRLINITSHVGITRNCVKQKKMSVKP